MLPGFSAPRSSRPPRLAFGAEESFTKKTRQPHSAHPAVFMDRAHSGELLLAGSLHGLNQAKQFEKDFTELWTGDYFRMLRASASSRRFHTGGTRASS